MVVKDGGKELAIGATLPFQEVACSLAVSKELEYQRIYLDAIAAARTLSA